MTSRRWTVSHACASAVRGTKLTPSGMPGTRTVAGTDNRSEWGRGNPLSPW